MRKLLAILLLVLLSGCSKPRLYQQESYVFGTRVVLSIWGVDECLAQQASSEVLAELDRLHAKLHAWRPSAVTRLNDAFAQGQSAPLDEELRGMLLMAADYAQRADNLFNPAVGQLVALWGFHRDTFEPVTPDPAALQQLLQARPSMADLQIGKDSVSSRNKAVSLDLGGFAKGWALDRVAAMLRARGIHNALINIGGNVMALGSKDGEAWKVGLQHPRKPAAMATIALQDGEAIGTSGDYQRFFEKDGKRYAHLIDPRSGQPAEVLQAATVIAPPGEHAGTLSDVTTKPIFIAGEANAPHFAARFGVKDVLLVDAQGRVAVTASMSRRTSWLEKPGRIDVIQ